MMPLIRIYSEIVSINGVQVEYLDRFLWTGTWQDFNWRKLLKEDSEFIVGVAKRVHHQWHCHCGWFEPTGKDARRLVNIDIDAADAVPPSATMPRPSLGIRTMIRDHVPPEQRSTDWLEPDSVSGLLDIIHEDLKKLLTEIITLEAAMRINLGVQ
jgi:hypothetical protein